MKEYAQLVIKEAVAAARAGQQFRACELLLELVETDANNELAWLWLSSFLPSLDEQILALETALSLNPQNPKARQRLIQLQTKQRAGQAEQQARHQQQLQQIKQLLAEGSVPEARERLLQLVAENEKSETAWWLLSQIIEDVADQVIALENLLTLNPNHAQARTLLAQKQRLQQEAMTLGLYYEEKKAWELAADAYERAAATHPDPAFRREAFFRQKAAELELKYPGILTSRSTLTWLRLSAGPPLFYGLLVFIHIGLRPLNITIPTCLGFLFVLLGSLALVGVYNTPLHVVWQKLFGPVGLNRPYARFILWLVGLFCTLLPFAHLLIISVLRLEHFTMP